MRINACIARENALNGSLAALLFEIAFHPCNHLFGGQWMRNLVSLQCINTQINHVALFADCFDALCNDF